MIGAALTKVLAEGRTTFNARFSEARRRHGGLCGDSLLVVLESCVDPLVTAVEDVRPDRTALVVSAAFDAAIELAGQRLLGPDARCRAIDEGWRRIFPRAAPLVAAEPARVIAAVSNALHRVGGTPGARWTDFVAGLEELAPGCADVETLLEVGKVVAWRAGLAHYRESALRVAAALPPELAARAIGAAGSKNLAKELERLAVDPWYVPGEDRGAGKLRLAARVGAFQGYGGDFAEPPRVFWTEGGFFATSGAERFILCADAFGATIHRDLPGPAPDPAPDLPGGLLGTAFLRGDERLDLPELGRVTSAAASRHTLALTSPYTHAVWLVALT